MVLFSMLYLRAIFWTVLLPGTVTIFLPALILDPVRSTVPVTWGIAQYFGLLLVTAGAAVILRCVWDFIVVGRGTLSPVDAPRHLVVTGLYRYVRNPMYIGVFLVLLGEIVFFASAALLIYMIAWFICVNLFVLLYEEPVLRSKFGESYEDYCRSVRRWLPRKGKVDG
jgi:protein-S-isoprenylcysteine O-methyltransferase Ste14